MKVLVIGATGALGAPAVKALALSGHEVRASARGDQSRGMLESLGAQPVQVDIYDTDSLRKAARGVDAVVRLTTKIPKSFAGMRHKSAWQETNRLRTIGAQRIVDAAIAEGVQVYVTESFFAAYASAGDEWVSEEYPSDDGDLDTLKALLVTERHAERCAHAGVRGIALRFGGFYGRNAPSTIEMLEMLRKRSLPILGTGRHFFPSVHVDDAARAIVSSLHAPSGTYNVCDDEPLRWAEFVEGAAQIADAPQPLRLPGLLAPVAVGYPWKWMSRSIRLSNARFTRTTGWTPLYTDALRGLASIAQQATHSHERVSAQT